jgi:hypothetical protein
MIPIGAKIAFLDNYNNSTEDIKPGTPT